MVGGLDPVVPTMYVLLGAHDARELAWRVVRVGEALVDWHGRAGQRNDLALACQKAPSRLAKRAFRQGWCGFSVWASREAGVASLGKYSILPCRTSRARKRAYYHIMAATPVAFAQGFADSSYRLFELEEPVLQEVLKNDGR